MAEQAYNSILDLSESELMLGFEDELADARRADSLSRDRGCMVNEIELRQSVLAASILLGVDQARKQGIMPKTEIGIARLAAAEENEHERVDGRAFLISPPPRRGSSRQRTKR